MNSQPARGSWRAQAAGRLLAPLRSALIASGVLQAIITLVQLAPFLLLVELARLLVSGAEPSRLREIGVAAVALLGFGTLLGAALTLWLHVVDARFASDLRSRLLSKLSRLPLGWFTARGSGSIKQLVADDTLSLHYLVTHAIPDAVAAVVAPLAVLVYLFVVDWRVALVLFVPVLVYLVLTSSMTIQSGPRIPQSQRWAERMSSEAGAYLEGQPVIRVFGGAAASSFRRRLDDYVGFLTDWQRPLAGKKTLMDLVTRPTTFLWLIVGTGTLLVVGGRHEAGQPVAVPVAGHHVRRPAAQHRLRPRRHPCRIAGRPPAADHPRRTGTLGARPAAESRPARRRPPWCSTGSPSATDPVYRWSTTCR